MSVEVGIDLFASLDGKLDKVMRQLEGEVYQQVIIGQLPGSGNLDEPGQLAPQRGQVWSVRRLTAVGWTAGSVTVYLDGLEPVVPFPSPAVNTFGRGELLVKHGQRLTVTATGITGSVQLYGAADTFPASYLSRYLR